MPLSRLSASAALGLCLAFPSFAALAQTAAPVPAGDVSDSALADSDGPIGDGSVADGADEGGEPHFVPIADACLSAPNETDCGQVRALVTECAADLDYEMCDVLFEAPDEVFDDPELLERAQEILTAASESIAQMQFPEAEGEIGEAVEATRALSERTLLRGAENLNSHSSPPLAADDKAVPNDPADTGTTTQP